MEVTRTQNLGAITKYFATGIMKDPVGPENREFERFREVIPDIHSVFPLYHLIIFGLRETLHDETQEKNRRH